LIVKCVAFDVEMRTQD